MAKKRITQITFERTALLTTDYIAADSATGTNNTGRISFPNLLAQLSGGPTSPTFQVKLSTLATAGLGGTSRLARGFDIFGTNAKATTAAAQYLFQVASSDAASPLALRFGITTHATATSRNGIIEVDDAGTKRPLILQPTGGNVGIGAPTNPLSKLTINGTGMLLHLGPNSTSVFGDANTASPRLTVGDPESTTSGLINLVATAAVNQGIGNVAFINYAIGASEKRIVNISAQALGAVNNGDFIINTMSVGTLSEKMRVSSGGNLGLGVSAFGAGAVKVMAFGNGTIPGTIADGFQLVSADVVAGQAAPHFVIENGPVIRLYQQAGIADPAGGGTIDAEARTAINGILAALENTRLLAIA